MYGKIFEHMFERSMVGVGSHVIAVWAYVIAKQKPSDSGSGYTIFLNPKVLAAGIGDTEKRMNQAVEFLCKPDPNSTNKQNDGRRLLKIAPFEYQVVSGEIYTQMKTAAELREYWKQQKRVQRSGE